MRFVYLFLFLPYLLLGQSTSSTVKGWQELTISDGLSQGMIFDVKQDQKGFLWIATKDGLNRYDGHNFKVFTHDPYNAFSLSGNYCSALLIDRKERIWVGTFNKGLNLFDPRTERFYHVTLNQKVSEKAGSYQIRQLTEDPEGNIWVATYNHLLFKLTLPAMLKEGFPEQADFSTQLSIESLILPVRDHSMTIQTLQFRANGQLLLWNGQGIYTTSWKRPALPVLSPLSSLRSPEADIWAVCTDSAQHYWFVATREHIRAWHAGQWRSIDFQERGVLQIFIRFLSPNRVAVLTRSFLWLMSPEELFQQNSLSANNAQAALPDPGQGVRTLLQDRTGNIWIGTPGYGLWKFNPRVTHFRAYMPGRSLAQLLVDRRGQLYAQQYSGYELFDRQTQTLKSIPGLSNTVLPQAYIFQDRAGFFWIYHTQSFPTTPLKPDHLWQFSSDWQLLRGYPMPTGVRFGEYGNQAVEDAAGQFWLGGINGKLVRFSPTTGQFRVFDYSHLLPQSGGDVEVYALLLESDGTLWIGTPEGLVRASSLHTRPTFTLFKNAIQDRQSLSDNFVLSLCADPRQPNRYLWVGTKGGGLDRLDKQTGTFTHFTEKQGLPNKVIYGILPDEQGHLWVSTNRGIARFDPQTGKVRTYTKADGLQDDEFNNQSYLKSPSGEMLFGGVNGLTVFRPSDIVGRNGIRPQVTLVGLRINNKSVEVGGDDAILPQSLDKTTHLTLNYDQNQVTFELAVLDYTNVDRNQFRYRLKGIDRDWVEAGTNRFANYAQLPDGHFELEVQGSADGEVWSEPVQLTIRVTPPFYRSWWAYLFYALVVGVLAWQFYRFQTQRLLLQQQVAFEQQEAGRLAELDTLKTQFFTNISHELRTPLTLILGPLNELISHGTENKLFAIMHRNARRLHMLINQILDLSRLDSGQLKLSLQEGELSRDLRVWIAGFESLAHSRQLSLSSTVTPVDCRALYDAEKLETIVVNLIANAIKFTEAGGMVQVSAVYEAETLTLGVADSGVGIAPEHLPHIFNRFYQGEAYQMPGYEGTGIGLALVRQLVQLMEGDISAISQPGVGTTFTVTIPLPQVAAADSQTEANNPPSISFVPDLLPVSGPDPQPAPVDYRPTVLVVEDNDDLRYYISTMLAPFYRILLATDGQQGVDQALEQIPDLIVTDLMMPRLDGLALCRQLRQDTRTNHIPIVMLTAKAAIEDRLAGLEIGADDYLTKPFVATELLVRLKNLLQRQRAMQAFFKQQLTTNQPAKPDTEALGQSEVTVQQAFVQQIYSVIDAHLDNSEFDIDELASHLAMSSRTLQRKLNAVVNVSAREVIRTHRLNRAADLLTTGLSPTEVAYQTGFSSPSNFSRAFREQFQVSPTAYAEGKSVYHKPQ